MQKVVNVLALASSVVSLAVVGIGGYVFINKDAIIKEATDKAMESVLGGLGGGGSLPSTDLPLGTNDLAPTAPSPDQAAAPQAPVQF
tara:strand:- start:256 stop:516 length:261 start_codon:yes stop_codon:yes gene_type:complete